MIYFLISSITNNVFIAAFWRGQYKLHTIIEPLEKHKARRYVNVKAFSVCLDLYFCCR